MVARRLAKEQWDVLISSDLRRARETAEIISAAIGKPVDFFDERLREMDRGLVTNTTESYFLGQILKELMRDESTGNDLLNTSVTTIVRNGKKWEYLLYNCVKHLNEQ